MGSHGSLYIPVKNAFYYSYPSSQECGVLYGDAITPENCVKELPCHSGQPLVFLSAHLSP